MRAYVIGNHVRQLLHQRAPGLRLAVHQRFRLQERARRAAFNQVTGQRERRAREADQWHATIQVATHEANRFHHVGQMLARVNRAQRVNVVTRANRIVDDGTFAGRESQLNAHRNQR